VAAGVRSTASVNGAVSSLPIASAVVLRLGVPGISTWKLPSSLRCSAQP
jgi:hypothetical protein